MEPSLSLVGIIVETVILAHPDCYSSAPPSTSVQIAIWILPKELTLEWDKQPLGDQIVTDVASLLKSDNTLQCKSHVIPLIWLLIIY